MAKKAKSVKEQTLEQKLWGAAEKLRGNLDAAEYKSVVLGLVFLKYINDSLRLNMKNSRLILTETQRMQTNTSVTISFSSQKKADGS